MPLIYSYKNIITFPQYPLSITPLTRIKVFDGFISLPLNSLPPKQQKTETCASPNDLTSRCGQNTFTQRGQSIMSSPRSLHNGQAHHGRADMKRNGKWLVRSLYPLAHSQFNSTSIALSEINMLFRGRQLLCYILR